MASRDPDPISENELRLLRSRVHESFGVIEERERVKDRLSIDEWRTEIAREGIPVLYSPHHIPMISGLLSLHT